MTEITTIDWFGRLGTSVFSENTAIFSLYFREILFCEYENHLTFHTYQTKQTDIIKQWQLIMVSLQLNPDIILGFR